MRSKCPAFRCDTKRSEQTIQSGHRFRTPPVIRDIRPDNTGPFFGMKLHSRYGDHCWHNGKFRHFFLDTMHHIIRDISQKLDRNMREKRINTADGCITPFENILHRSELIPDFIREFNCKKSPNHILIYCTVHHIGLPIPPFPGTGKEVLFLHQT